LELLFGCIRQGGNNNNPTARQFKAAIKKILVHAEIRDIHTGNCIPLEHVSILHVSSSNNISNSEDVINISTRLSQITQIAHGRPIDVQWMSEFGHWDIQKTCELSSTDIH